MRVSVENIFNKKMITCKLFWLFQFTVKLQKHNMSQDFQDNVSIKTHGRPII